eukprot:jgi/Galph1/2163/GphlegSOOS_G865.1
MNVSDQDNIKKEESVDLRVEKDSHQALQCTKGDRDDLSSDSAVSVFDRMKPYWGAGEGDKKTPISPISSNSCLYSSCLPCTDDSSTEETQKQRLLRGQFGYPIGNVAENDGYSYKASPLPFNGSQFPWNITRTIFPDYSSNLLLYNTFSKVVGSPHDGSFRNYSQDYLYDTNVSIYGTLPPLVSNAPTEDKQRESLGRKLSTVEPGEFSKNLSSFFSSDQENVGHRHGKNPPMSSSLQMVDYNSSHLSKLGKNEHPSENKDSKMTKRYSSLISTTVDAPTQKKNRFFKRDNYLRFEKWEEENLLLGVEKYGVGKWTSILRNFLFKRNEMLLILKISIETL